MNKITQYLNQHIVGNVFDKASIRDAFANDRSIVKHVPRFVAVPENTDDIRKIARFCNQLAVRNYHLPITVRGNGHDKTGAAIGGGIVISTECLNQIPEIDIRGRLVRVQAGVTIGQLNSALALHGMVIPVASHPDETIGGLIGNCPADEYSGKYGGIYNYVDRLEAVLPNGELLQTSILSRHALSHKKGQTSTEGKLYREIDRLIDDNMGALGKIGTNGIDLAGYASAALVKQKKTFDLMPLFFGAQGTLGIVTEAILRCELLPPEPKRLLICFTSLRSAVDFMNFAKNLNPLISNFYDGRILKSAVDYGKKPNILTRKLDSGYVVLIGFNDTPRKTKKKLKKCIKHLPKSASFVIENEDNSTDFTELRSATISYLNDGVLGERAPIADDTFIPLAKLVDFIDNLHELEKSCKMPLPLFGSFTTENYSVRPELKLDQISGRQFALKFLRDYSAIVRDNQGSLTGGGPEGCVKAIVTDIPEKQRELYTSIKQAFDPNNIMNPDVKLGADAKNTIRRLRTYYNYYVVE